MAPSSPSLPGFDPRSVVGRLLRSGDPIVPEGEAVDPRSGDTGATATLPPAADVDPPIGGDPHPGRRCVPRVEDPRLPPSRSGKPQSDRRAGRAGHRSPTGGARPRKGARLLPRGSRRAHSSGARGRTLRLPWPGRGRAQPLPPRLPRLRPGRGRRCRRVHRPARVGEPAGPALGARPRLGWRELLVRRLRGVQVACREQALRERCGSQRGSRARLLQVPRRPGRDDRPGRLRPAVRRREQPSVCRSS